MLKISYMLKVKLKISFLTYKINKNMDFKYQKIKIL